MISRARQNGQETDVSVRFEAVGFGELAETFGPGSFEGLLCLGNSLPHLLSPGGRAGALRDFANCLSPQGLLILQNRNFDAVMAARERSMDPASHFEGDQEWVFLRFYEYLPDGLINFNIVTLQRKDRSPWIQSMTTTQLLPLLKDDLLADLEDAGFQKITCFGGLNGTPFDPASSGNLVVTAQKA
jgi:glycine/sarcosine N-methyltransferase